MQVVHTLAYCRDVSLSSPYSKALLINLCYSYLCCKKWFNDIAFHGDDYYLNVVNNDLNLKYNEFVNYKKEDMIECLDTYWCYPKLLSMSKVTKQSFFIDYDVHFLGNPFEMNIFKYDVGTQEIECCTASNEYKCYVDNIIKYKDHLTEYKEFGNFNNLDILAYNTGILYFKDYKISNEFAKKSINLMKTFNKMFDYNYSGMYLPHVTFTIGSEQWYLKKFTDYNNLIVSTVKESYDKDVLGYVHTHGKKDDWWVTYRLLKRIKREDFSLYKRLFKILKLTGS